MLTVIEDCYLEVKGKLSVSKDIIEELQQEVLNYRHGDPKVFSLMQALRHLHRTGLQGVQELKRLSEAKNGDGVDLIESVEATLRMVHWVTRYFAGIFNL